MLSKTYKTTNKIFYKKYLYRVQISEPYASYFRTYQNKNYSLTRKRLDAVGFKRLYKVYTTNSAEALYNILINADEDYLLRVEYNLICVYSNNLDFCEKIADCAFLVDPMFISDYSFTCSIHKPDPKYINVLENNSNIILTNVRPAYQYKVSFNNNSIDKSFLNWLSNSKNASRVRISKIILNNIKINYQKGGYFYVKDESTLILVRMMIANSIGRIEKYICKADIDK